MSAAPVYQIPSTHFENNTGPKGVIADAQSYERARKRSFRQTIYGLSNALTANVVGVSEKLSVSGRRRGSAKSASESSEDEDEFMRSWREKRMQELQAQGRDIRNRRLSPSKRSWGNVTTVDPVGYLDAIEKVPADTTVVVLIHDEDVCVPIDPLRSHANEVQSTVSGIVEDAMSTIARKHEYTRFIKMNYRDAEMTPAAVPAILAYRTGDLIANLVSVIDEIPDGRDLSTSSLEFVLRQ